MQENDGLTPGEEHLEHSEDEKQAAHEEFIAQLEEASVKKKSEKPRGKRRRIWFWLTIVAWAFFLFGVLGFIITIKQIKAGKYGELPTAEDIENPRNPIATNVYTHDGKIIGKYYTENRTNVSYDELSPYLVDALIATEDERFTRHAGIDFKALFRVAVRTVLGGDRSGGGGSTLTQQLAKNLYRLRGKHDNNMVIKKMQEWVIAVQLESKYTKEEILTMYLNTVDFLYGAFGIHAAAHTYFGKDPKDLDMVEAATLVGMLKGPGLYNPAINADTAKYRRKIVYLQMHRNGFLTEAEKDSLKEADLTLNMSRESHNTGLAPYFREQLRQYLHEWQAKTGYNIYRDGLKVYTTLDSRVQEHAETAMKDHMKYLQGKFFEHWKDKDLPWVTGRSVESQVRFSQRYNWLIKRCARKYKRRPNEEDVKKDFGQEINMRVFSYRGEIDTVMTPHDSVTYYKHFLQTGMMAVESETGYILAWVGGVDHKHFKYDHVNKNAKRQVGSTFKPFVYAAGLEAGYGPCVTLPNIPPVWDNIITGYDKKGEPVYGSYDPRNSDAVYGGNVPLIQGIALSNNATTLQLLKRLGDVEGPKTVVKKAQDFGITSDMKPYPTIALGVFDVSVYEMVGAFNTFNNNGLWVEPLYVTKIEDQYGNIIESFVPKSREALSPENNYYMVKMMQKVVQRGTGVRLISSNYYGIRTAMAGKTGTTQKNADGWFIGYQPGITAGVWVGGEEPSVYFRTMEHGQGARMAMPIFGDFMVAINEDENLDFGDVNEFAPPKNTNLRYSFDCEWFDLKSLKDENRGLDDDNDGPRLGL